MPQHPDSIWIPAVRKRGEETMHPFGSHWLVRCESSATNNMIKWVGIRWNKTWYDVDWLYTFFSQMLVSGFHIHPTSSEWDSVRSYPHGSKHCLRSYFSPLNHTPVPLPQKVRLDPSMGSPLGRPRQVYNSLCSAFEKGQKWQNILELLSGSGKRSAKGQEMPRTGEENATDKRRKHYVIMSGNVRYESWWSMIRLV